MGASERRSGANLDLRSLLPWMALASLLILGPYLVAWLATPPEMVFTGTLANHNDLASYLSAMRQGGEGRWLYEFKFSPEVWQPVLYLPVYMVTGKVAAVFGGPLELWFNLLRLPALLVAFLGLLFWVRQVFPGRRRLQLVAWLLIVFGGGISWLAWPLANYFSLPLSSFPDLSMPEWTTLLIAVNAPHYLLGMGLEAVAFGCILRLSRSWHRRRWTVIGAAATLLLGLTYAYNSAVVVPVLVLYLLSLAVSRRRVLGQIWLHLALVVLPLFPLLFYYGYWVNRDPAWAAFVSGSLNKIPPPPLSGLVIGLGLLGLFAGVGLVIWVRHKEEWLVPLWLVGNLSVMYVPFVAYTGRLALGVIIPVGTLAAYGLVETTIPWLEDATIYSAFARLSPTPSETFLRSFLLLMVPSTLMASLLMVQNSLVRQEFPNYMVAKDRAVAAMLATHTDQSDVVLAAYPVGNYLPTADDAHVFLGQLTMTLHFEDKLAQMERFYAADTPLSWRHAFLEKWCIDYVYQGTYERQLMDGALEVPGEVVYQRDGITIYHFPDVGNNCEVPGP